MIDKVDRSVEQLVDEILVMDCRSGKVKALEKLVSRWQKRLWRYAYDLTWDAEAAWDITQESWLGIIKGLRKLNDPANFKAWAYRITTNKSIDWIRKSKAVKKPGIEEIQDHQHKAKKDSGLKELLERLDICSLPMIRSRPGGRVTAGCFRFGDAEKTPAITGCNPLPKCLTSLPGGD